MAINGSAIKTVLAESADAKLVIEMLTTQPQAGSTFSPPRPPGQLVGFYNGSTDSVELYVVSASGLRFFRVV